MTCGLHVKSDPSVLQENQTRQPWKAVQLDDRGQLTTWKTYLPTAKSCYEHTNLLTMQKFTRHDMVHEDRALLLDLNYFSSIISSISYLSSLLSSSWITKFLDRYNHIKAVLYPQLKIRGRKNVQCLNSGNMIYELSHIHNQKNHLTLSSVYLDWKSISILILSLQLRG